MTPAERSSAWRRLHPDRERATKAAYRAANPEKWKAQKLAAGSRFREKNRQAIRDAARNLRIQLRIEVIIAYGGCCSCPGCHVHHEELLTVDHVNGGAHHRTNRRSTRDIYKQIKKEGFPPTYQLLCGSCNLAKSDRAACPLAGIEH